MQSLSCLSNVNSSDSKPIISASALHKISKDLFIWSIIFSAGVPLKKEHILFTKSEDFLFACLSYDNSWSFFFMYESTGSENYFCCYAVNCFWRILVHDCSLSAKSLFVFFSWSIWLSKSCSVIWFSLSYLILDCSTSANSFLSSSICF